MAYTPTLHDGDNVTTDFTIGFAFSRKSVIEVEVDSVPASFVFLGADQVTITPAPPATQPENVVIKRNTPIEPPFVDFQNGSGLTEGDLDLSSSQQRHYTEEQVFLSFVGLERDGGGNWDAVTGRLVNLSLGVDPGDAMTMAGGLDIVADAEAAQAAAETAEFIASGYAVDTAADAVLTAADVVLTHADVVTSALLAASTAEIFIVVGGDEIDTVKSGTPIRTNIAQDAYEFDELAAVTQITASVSDEILTAITSEQTFALKADFRYADSNRWFRVKCRFMLTSSDIAFDAQFRVNLGPLGNHNDTEIADMRYAEFLPPGTENPTLSLDFLLQPDSGDTISVSVIDTDSFGADDCTMHGPGNLSTHIPTAEGMQDHSSTGETLADNGAFHMGSYIEVQEVNGI
jgi:hypothetical protein